MYLIQWKNRLPLGKHIQYILCYTYVKLLTNDNHTIEMFKIIYKMMSDDDISSSLVYFDIVVVRSSLSLVLKQNRIQIYTFTRL